MFSCEYLVQYRYRNSVTMQQDDDGSDVEMLNLDLSNDSISSMNFSESLTAFEA